MNGNDLNDLQFFEANMLSGFSNAGRFGGIRNHSYFTGSKHSASSRKHKYLLEDRKGKQ
jgi:hypothetical protein